MIRFYVMPIVGTGTSRLDARRPKYLDAYPDLQWAMMDYGLEPVCLVCVRNIDQTTHDALVANADVLAAPENIDANLSTPAVTVIGNFFEALNIPGGWLSPSLTYRTVLRTVAGLFQFAQRWHGMGGGAIFTDGLDLSVTYAALPTAKKTMLIDVADSFGYDYSSLGASSTLRQILKFLADQWGAAPFYMGGVEL